MADVSFCCDTRIVISDTLIEQAQARPGRSRARAFWTIQEKLRKVVMKRIFGKINHGLYEIVWQEKLY